MLEIYVFIPIQNEGLRRKPIVGRKGAEVGHRTWNSVVKVVNLVVDLQIRSTRTNSQSQNHIQSKLTEVVDNWGGAVLW